MQQFDIYKANHIEKQITSDEKSKGMFILSGSDFKYGKEIFRQYLGSNVDLETPFGVFCDRRLEIDEENEKIFIRCLKLLNHLKENKTIYIRPKAKSRILITTLETTIPLDKLQKWYNKFKEDKVYQLLVKVRRYRARQIKSKLENTKGNMELEDFNKEIWQIASGETVIDGENFGKPFTAKEIDFDVLNKHYDKFISSINERTLELHGNYIWDIGSSIFQASSKIKDKSKQKKAIQKGVKILIDKERTPEEKWKDLCEIKGFAKKTSSGFVMLFHPNKFALYNEPTIEAMKNLGFKFNNDFVKFQEKIRKLREILKAEDFLELDLFLYVFIYKNINKYPLLQNFWWVCQGSTPETAIKAEYLWAKKEGKYYHTNLKHAKRGDIVFHYRDKLLFALSKVICESVISEQPEESLSDRTTSDVSEKTEGYLLKLETYELEDDHQIFLDDIPREWRKKERKRAKSPFDKNEDQKEGYFFKISNHFALKLLAQFPSLLEIYLNKIVKVTKKTSNTLGDQRMEFRLDTLGNCPNGLYFKNWESVKSKIEISLMNGKHLILIGPPGTGKSKLAKSICRCYKGLEGYKMATATSDWSTFETIGGYRLSSKDDSLKFYPNIFLQCLKPKDKSSNKWLIIDEINRADIDKAFGSLFSALTGDNVELPYESENGKKVRIIGDIENIGLGSSIEWQESDYVVSKDWRIIATMNTYDKASLYEMSYAFMRRFAFIPVDIPDDIDADLIRHYYDVWNDLDHLSDDITKKIAKIWEIINKYRKIGPAIIEDICRYIKESEEIDWISPIILFVLPQLEGLMEPKLKKFYSRLKEDLDDSFDKDKELKNYMEHFFGIKFNDDET